MLNSVDALTLGEDLIKIRSKTYERRTLSEVSEGKRLGFRLANVVVVPVLVVLFGLIRLAMRRRDAEEYAAKIRAGGGTVR